MHSSNICHSVANLDTAVRTPRSGRPPRTTGTPAYPVCESGVCQRGRHREEASVRISVGLSGLGQDPRIVSSRVNSLTCLLDRESPWIGGQVVAVLWAPAHLLDGGKN